jgi:hypothetical protein
MRLLGHLLLALAAWAGAGESVLVPAANVSGLAFPYPPEDAGFVWPEQSAGPFGMPELLRRENFGVAVGAAPRRAARRPAPARRRSPPPGSHSGPPPAAPASPAAHAPAARRPPCAPPPARCRAAATARRRSRWAGCARCTAWAS